MQDLKIFVNLPDFNFDPQNDRDILTIAGYARMAHADDIPFQVISFQNNPSAFLQEPEVDRLLEEIGDEAMPITLVNGEVKASGRYPSKQELEDILGTELLEVNVEREAMMQKALSQMAAYAEGGCGCDAGACGSCAGCF